MTMDDETRWKVLLNEAVGKKVRLILSSRQLRRLVYATVQRESAARIVSAVSSREWSRGQLIGLLSPESEQILQEVL